MEIGIENKNKKETNMENNPDTDNNPKPQAQTPPAPFASETKSFMKKAADKLPGWMFPKLNPQSAHTCAIIGLVLGAFSLLLALVPCVGGNAWFFGLIALYVCLLALRCSSSSEQKNGTLTTIGMVLAVLATLIAVIQIAVVNEAADNASRELDRLERSFDGNFGSSFDF